MYNHGILFQPYIPLDQSATITMKQFINIFKKLIQERTINAK